MRWFTSDLHFGHENIIRYAGRPFSHVEEMNETLVHNWNSTVDPDDEVWVLGDFALGKIQETITWAELLYGNLVLLAGNHDRCWEGHKKGAKQWTQRYLDAGFSEVYQGTIITEIAGRPVLASHFPYRGDHTVEQRYVEHRPTDRGAPLLHGHIHEQWKVNGRQINVGCDVWDYKPVSEAELAGLLAPVAQPR